MTYGELLEDLGKRLNLTLTPDESGTVNLDVDGLSLAIVGLENLEMAVLTGEVGDVPPEDHRERLYMSILMANHNFAGTGGAMFSVNPENGRVCLSKTLAVPLLDGEKLFAEVEGFVNKLETWHKIVTDFNGAELDAEGHETAGGAASAPAANDFGGGMGGLGGFMQV